MTEEILKRLCNTDATAGDEKNIRDIIIDEIKDFCEYSIDNSGNILVKKEGKKKTDNKIMFDAHTDEVGIIITKIQKDGFLRFKTVGGINVSALLFKRVKINGKTVGVIGKKPIHLTKGDEAKSLPDESSLYIDIGAKDEAQARRVVTEGDRGVLSGEFSKDGDRILSKALDDRVGCAVLIDLIKSDTEYGFCASFSSAEEIGCRGAKTAAFTLSPDFCIVLEGTTASDIPSTPPENRVCEVGGGVAVSFMDGGCVYDRDLFNAAVNSGIAVQVKKATAGGNDSKNIHLSKSGVKTLALSLPCRYIHSTSSVSDKRDIEAMRLLGEYMLKYCAEKKI